MRAKDRVKCTVQARDLLKSVATDRRFPSSTAATTIRSTCWNCNHQRVAAERRGDRQRENRKRSTAGGNANSAICSAAKSPMRDTHHNYRFCERATAECAPEGSRCMSPPPARNKPIRWQAARQLHNTQNSCNINRFDAKWCQAKRPRVCKLWNIIAAIVGYVTLRKQFWILCSHFVDCKITAIVCTLN